MASTKSKGKSQVSRGKPANYSQMYSNAATGAADLVTAGAGASNPAAARASSETAARLKTSDDVNWGEEYAYVIDDLVRLGLVTAGLIVAIIIAGLFV